MNYMLLVYKSEDPEVCSALGPVPTGCEGFAEKFHETGHYLAGGILHETSSATSVRVRSGKRLVTDGPFAETREQLAGYVMLEAANLDEAIHIASHHPVARVGTIEVRPVAEIPSVLGEPISK